MKNSNVKGNSSVQFRASIALACGLAIAAGQAWGQAPADPAAPVAPTPPADAAPAKVDTAAANAALSPQMTVFAARFEAENKIKLILIPAGQFVMGGGGRGGAHPVTISRPFLIGATDVTQAQWTAVMGDNPSHFKDDTRPVERVSWDEAKKFGQKLTERELAAGHLPLGYIFTLPTSAQWEYACRAGTTGDYAGDIAEMGWYDLNADSTTHPVAQKKPNPWGLYDMHGNVWQWCADHDGDYPAGAVADPSGPAQGPRRILRGGSWCCTPRDCRAGYRNWVLPTFKNVNVGFRVCLDL